MDILNRWINRNFKNSIIKVSKLSIWINVDSKGILYLNIVKTSKRYYKLFLLDIYNKVSCYSTRSMFKLIDFLEGFVLSKTTEIYVAPEATKNK